MEKIQEEIEETDKYKRLPDQYEIHEFSIMKDFAYSLKDDSGKYELLQILNRRKSYRNFKDAIREMGIADQYYQFRKNAFYIIAVNWCRERDIPFEE